LLALPGWLAMVGQICSSHRPDLIQIQRQPLGHPLFAAPPDRHSPAPGPNSNHQLRPGPTPAAIPGLPPEPSARLLALFSAEPAVEGVAPLLPCLDPCQSSEF
jgi:hypothetical protein